MLPIWMRLLVLALLAARSYTEFCASYLKRENLVCADGNAVLDNGCCASTGKCPDACDDKGSVHLKSGTFCLCSNCKKEPTLELTWKERWVKAHNYFRCRHGQRMVVWSRDVADNAYLAIKSSEAAKRLMHTQSYTMTPPAGENLALGHHHPEDVVESWYVEINTAAGGAGYIAGTTPRDSRYKGRSKFGNRSSNAVGHYTAMIWNSSTVIGCRSGKLRSGHIWACQYALKPANDGDKASFVRNIPQENIATETEDTCCSRVYGNLSTPTPAPTPRPTPSPRRRRTDRRRNVANPTVAPTPYPTHEAVTVEAGPNGWALVPELAAPRPGYAALAEAEENNPWPGPSLSAPACPLRSSMGWDKPPRPPQTPRELAFNLNTSGATVDPFSGHMLDPKEWLDPSLLTASPSSPDREPTDTHISAPSRTLSSISHCTISNGTGPSERYPCMCGDQECMPYKWCHMKQCMDWCLLDGWWHSKGTFIQIKGNIIWWSARAFRIYDVSATSFHISKGFGGGFALYTQHVIFLGNGLKFTYVQPLLSEAPTPAPGRDDSSWQELNGWWQDKQGGVWIKIEATTLWWSHRPFNLTRRTVNSVDISGGFGGGSATYTDNLLNLANGDVFHRYETPGTIAEWQSGFMVNLLDSKLSIFGVVGFCFFSLASVALVLLSALYLSRRRLQRRTFQALPESASFEFGNGRREQRLEEFMLSQ